MLKKNKVLGIPHGTAQARLRRNLIFHLARLAGLDICYRCDKLIETQDTISIDHKEDWLNSDNPVEKFFDISNIAFSHKKCNKPYLGGSFRGNSTSRREQDSNTSWCSKCRDFLPISNFYKHKNGRWNGLARICKPHSEIQKGRKSLKDFPHLEK
jgi:hypothetical protein